MFLLAATFRLIESSVMSQATLSASMSRKVWHTNLIVTEF